MQKFLLILTLFYLTSCSKIETGLYWAPRFVVNRIDEAFDFSTKKKSKIKEQFQIDLDQTKKNLFKKILLHLDQIESLYLNKTPSQDTMIAFYNDLADTQSFIINHFKNTAELTLNDLSLKEIQTFKNYTHEKFEEEIKLSLDSEKFIKKRTESLIKFYEFFIDDLTDEQIKLSTDFIKKNADYFKSRIKIRQAFTKTFLEKLENKESVTELFIKQYSGLKFDDLKNSDQKNYLLDLFEFQKKITSTLNQKQKEFFKNKMIELRTEVFNLSL